MGTANWKSLGTSAWDPRPTQALHEPAAEWGFQISCLVVMPSPAMQPRFCWVEWKGLGRRGEGCEQKWLGKEERRRLEQSQVIKGQKEAEQEVWVRQERWTRTIWESGGKNHPGGTQEPYPTPTPKTCTSSNLTFDPLGTRQMWEGLLVNLGNSDGTP